MERSGDTVEGLFQFDVFAGGVGGGYFGAFLVKGFDQFVDEVVLEVGLAVQRRLKQDHHTGIKEVPGNSRVLLLYGLGANFIVISTISGRLPTLIGGPHVPNPDDTITW